MVPLSFPENRGLLFHPPWSTGGLLGFELGHFRFKSPSRHLATVSLGKLFNLHESQLPPLQYESNNTISQLVVNNCKVSNLHKAPGIMPPYVNFLFYPNKLESSPWGGESRTSLEGEREREYLALLPFNSKHVGR